MVHEFLTHIIGGYFQNGLLTEGKLWDTCRAHGVRTVVVLQTDCPIDNDSPSSHPLITLPTPIVVSNGELLCTRDQKRASKYEATRQVPFPTRIEYGAIEKSPDIVDRDAIWRRIRGGGHQGWIWACLLPWEKSCHHRERGVR